MSRVHDVCLLLEGSYPFVSGGVSVWVHNLIRSLPDIDFTAICILASSREKSEIKYELPENFRDFKVVYVHDPVQSRPHLFRDMKPGEIERIRKFHYGMKSGDPSIIHDMIKLFRGGTIRLEDLLHGRRSWDFLLELYGPNNNQDSFLDYFWTYRFTHLPIFRMLQSGLPKARVYHCISTGYAGLLGSIASIISRRPMLLTEHGIYVKERKIEISQAEWIQSRDQQRIRVERDLGTFQKFWIKIFESLGKLTYDYASRIITLYEGNRLLEIAEGADPAKIEIIPNGINLDYFRNAMNPDRTPPEPSGGAIGFIGRVVPIKDVKTFLRAVKIVSLKRPDLKAYIMGPTDEDEEYYEECRDLTQTLGLERIVEYTGRVNIRDYLPNLDLIVLTSISEAQPLVVLEANCVGVPCVCSDVGACSELLAGRIEEDAALGPSGLVTKVADPIATAEAISAILESPETWRAMSEAGMKRVRQFYRESDLNDRYRDIYRTCKDLPDME
ncbi:GT4 family glycosyltransferase PelF [Pseudodesulfovibrio tunisiensis]|uniref:GT4 family glycosyltransferase PelF n=1 Tax=Pseudodesulfovibrio tunisiensis TaxID=463192 RepID=UPI001FB1FAF0|nr:GT4 family glycosyltransferase PelF [Pseudodesulfovibrio tunisiensis]